MSNARLRSILLTLGWFALFFGLSRYGAELLPRAWARQVTLEQFLLGVQLITLALCLPLAARWLPHGLDDLALGVRDAKGLRRALLVAALLGPLLYVISNYAAMASAYSTLLDEIRQGGIRQANANAGELGRLLVATPLWLTLLWAGFAAPLGEELLFRGALWNAVGAWVPPARALAPETEEASFIRPVRLWGLSAADVAAWAQRGGIAWLVTSGAFGALHLGLPGGQGILRVVSTTLIGIGCGLCRMLTGSIWPAVVLHVSCNVLSLAAARNWLVSSTFPRYLAIPTLAAVMALIGALAATALLVTKRR